MGMLILELWGFFAWLSLMSAALLFLFFVYRI